MMAFAMLLFVHLKNDISVSHRVFVLKSDLSDNLDEFTCNSSTRQGNERPLQEHDTGLHVFKAKDEVVPVFKTP
jgi:hypothetical protein